MNKELLKQFFKEHTIETTLPTACSITNFFIGMDKNSGYSEDFQKKLNKIIFESKKEREQASIEIRSKIESAVTFEQVVKIMRSESDPVNHFVLIKKAMEFEEQIVPDIIRRLKTSFNDFFIEIAVRVLAHSNKDFSGELIGYFDEIRNPYAQSQILVLLGFFVDESYIPWLIERYHRLKKHYPGESFYEGAYYALVEIKNRFYSEE